MHVKRAIWLIALVSVAGLTASCGDDGTTDPGTTGPDKVCERPEGHFTCSHTRGEALGPLDCREDHTIYQYMVSLDWWTDEAQDVDSVIFWVPSNEAIWMGPLECLADAFHYKEKKATKNGDHWEFTDPLYGHRTFHPLTDLWFSLEFLPDSLAKAQVFVKNCADTLYENLSVPE